MSLDLLAETLPPQTVCEQAVHEAIKASERAFAACRFIGFQRSPTGGALELRNCTRVNDGIHECGSTLAKAVK